MKKKFVVVGTGGRSSMFIDPIVNKYREACELLAFCDLSPVRMEYHRNRIMNDFAHSGQIKMYAASEFDRMLDETKPDAVVICTVDATHSEYVIRSVRKGCDVICEKPLTTDERQCAAILEAARATGRNVRVTFNMRWMPGATKIRELIQEGKVGRIKHIHMEYLLDYRHGSDYFRRWHSHKELSGGLLVHKSTHHFDAVNWWLDAIPERVFAEGRLTFYGKKNALERGDEKLTAYDRYTGIVGTGDPYGMDLTASAINKGLYLDAESETGYIRDRNVFREDIDIEDVMSVIVKYRGGAILTYSMVAFSPWEGFRVNITGDRGRIEYEENRNPDVIEDCFNGDGMRHEIPNSDEPCRLRYMPLHGEWKKIPIKAEKEEHGGADPLIQENIFSATPLPDPYNRSAFHEQGIASAIIGIAANKSMATGQAIEVASLVNLNPAARHLADLR